MKAIIGTFVYTYQQRICDKHYNEFIKQYGSVRNFDSYAYIDHNYSEGPCSTCLDEIRKQALNENRIFWSLKDHGTIIFESPDRTTFWNEVKKYKSKTYQIEERIL